MIKRFQNFLGPERSRALFLLLASTGLMSLILNAVSAEWVRPVQTLLALAFVVGAAVIIIGRLPGEERGRWYAISAPAIGLVLIGLLLVPEYLLLTLGLAVGWVIAGSLLFRARAPMQYQKAVKHLRKNEYADAVKVLDDLIKEEPNNVQHYDFRARLFRVWGKLDRAKRDYKKITEIAPDLVAGYNALSEVYLQTSEYALALEAAEKAAELAPKQWVAFYNLGMIEDRLGQSEAVIEHLSRALALKVDDARHRLLIHLYLARAYSRLKDMSAAQTEIAAIKQHRNGLKDWQTLMASDQAETLRAVLGADVKTAQEVADGQRDAASLAREPAR
ncbi:MAG: tetratricopeptide repeat protein [Anaerolineae bacterium]